MKNFFDLLKPPPAITPDQILTALGTVLDPEVNRDIVSLGMVHNVMVRDGVVNFTVRLREAGSPLQVPIERRAKRAVMNIEGVRDVQIDFEVTPNSQLRDTTRLNLEAKHVIAVASGKGGVGKSTVAVNLAVALAQMKNRVGLLDGDIHGPNIPMMMGLPDEKPMTMGEKIYPPIAHGIAVMSMGFLVPANAPVIWRGPMLHQALRQLLRDVLWGQLDYLIIDLPPGTGDVQLTLTQSVPLTGAVLVTTPQDVSVADVIKGGEMFRQLDIPLLGLIENMSYYVCPHCGEKEKIFGEGGGAALSQKLGTKVLAQIPLEGRVRQCGDGGIPVVLASPESESSQAFHRAAESILAKTKSLPPIQLQKPQVSLSDPELRIL
ncbi:MAG: Mrp/NBP35 family ATP-binding protein [Chloroflexi bacterium]|nr:Mrp/NBP35 family ATP-binding protein [Chloroflexota bacterium]